MLGTPGSGKSFSAKREITNAFLICPKDDIIICDPEGEYTPLVERLHGQVLSLIHFSVKDEWFSDDVRKLDDDNVYRKLQGHWIIEMSEMIATANAKSIEEKMCIRDRIHIIG